MSSLKILFDINNVELWGAEKLKLSKISKIKETAQHSD
jgi:hypothetical protein